MRVSNQKENESEPRRSSWGCSASISVVACCAMRPFFLCLLRTKPFLLCPPLVVGRIEEKKKCLLSVSGQWRQKATPTTAGLNWTGRPDHWAFLQPSCKVLTLMLISLPQANWVFFLILLLPHWALLSIGGFLVQYIPIRLIDISPPAARSPMPAPHGGGNKRAAALRNGPLEIH